MSHDAIQIPEDQNILWQKSYQSFLILLSQGKRNKSKISKWDLSSVQFRHSVMSDFLWPHKSQHARPPCPIPTPGVHINSCASSPWCHPTISSSVIPFSSCPESLPASGSFPVSQLFHMRWPKYWSFSLMISPSNEHPGLVSFMMDWLDLFAVQGTRKKTVQKHQCFGAQLSSQSNSHIHTGPQEKP